MIAITICGLISGCDHYVAIHAFGNTHKDWLSTFLELPNGIPSHDTFSRFFSRLNPDHLQLCYIYFVNSLERYCPMK